MLLPCTNFKKCRWIVEDSTALEEHLNLKNLTQRNWLDGCDYSIIKCVFCGDEEYERSHFKKRLSEPELTQDDLKDVLEVLWNARDKWYNIGLQLRIDPSTLDAIAMETMKHESDERLRHTLLSWLRSAGKKTWKMLYDALRVSSVNEENTATEVLLGK